MYYYEVKENMIIKSLVNIDIETLKTLRGEIIDKCSEIVHKSYETTNMIDYSNTDHIRNFKKKNIGMQKANIYSYAEPLYWVSYDLYKHPKLVSLIDRLLKGDTAVINQINNPDFEEIKKEKYFVDSKVKFECDIIKEQDLDEQVKALMLKEYEELNKNQIPVNGYYEKVSKCIMLEEVAKLPLETVLNVESFLNDVKETTVDNNVNKVLKLSNNKHNKNQ